MRQLGVKVLLIDDNYLHYNTSVHSTKYSKTINKTDYVKVSSRNAFNELKTLVYQLALNVIC